MVGQILTQTKHRVSFESSRIPVGRYSFVFLFCELCGTSVAGFPAFLVTAFLYVPVEPVNNFISGMYQILMSLRYVFFYLRFLI